MYDFGTRNLTQMSLVVVYCKTSHYNCWVNFGFQPFIKNISPHVGLADNKEMIK